MSDIIIEGKNLDDITQSNFQTVGVRSTLYGLTSEFSFFTNPQYAGDLNNSETFNFNFPDDFTYTTLKEHANRYGIEVEDFNNSLNSFI